MHKMIEDQLRNAVERTQKHANAADLVVSELQAPPYRVLVTQTSFLLFWPTTTMVGLLADEKLPILVRVYSDSLDHPMDFAKLGDAIQALRPLLNR